MERRSNHLCRVCQSIFRGPLRSKDDPNVSIRIDCWEWSPESAPPSIRPNYTYQNPPQDGGEETQLPAAQFLCGKFLHLNNGFIVDEDSLDEFSRNDTSKKGPVLEGELATRYNGRAWRRYGTHHKSFMSFSSSATNGCMICRAFAMTLQTVNIVDLATTKSADTGFSTYGLYLFKNSQMWLTFHLGAPLYMNTTSVNMQSPRIHLICQPEESAFHNMEIDITDIMTQV
jgi:hypothetical protein